MSKLDYCFEPYKSPNVHATKKRICDEHVRQHSTSKILFLSLTYSRTSRSWAWGCWYVSNVSIIFDCSMLLYYHSWIFYNHFIATLYQFLGLTYWHSAQCQLLFFACFFTSQEINIKQSPNIAKLFVVFLWTTRLPMGQSSTWGCPKGGTTHQGTPGAQAHLSGLCPPRWPPAPPLCSINTPIVDENQFQSPQVPEPPDPI